MVIILPCIIGQRLSGQLPTRLREIKRMFQEMFRRDVFIYFVEMFVHRTCYLPQITQIYAISIFSICASLRNLWTFLCRFQNVFDAADGDDDPGGAVI